VAVIDRQGYYPAIDAAQHAAGSGRPVVIVTEDGFVSNQLGSSGELTPWYQAAAAAGIELRPFTRVLAIDEAGLQVRHRFGGDTEERLEADCVVLADHELPEDGLYRELLAEGVKVRRIGDCVAPRRALHAIWEGGQAGREA
jgi:2,4-dienoyl-CoA reductase (NADPH2)